MVSSSTQRRRGLVALLGLFAVVCGALFAAPGSARAAEANGQPAPQSSPHVQRPAGHGVQLHPGAEADSPRAGAPGAGSGTEHHAADAGTERHTGNPPSAQHRSGVQHTVLASDDGGDGTPGCHKQQGHTSGTVPAAPTGVQQNVLPGLTACPAPESHTALGVAHARPPVRGPSPIPPPTPAELSVLRV